jgi:hypothetical protein
MLVDANETCIISNLGWAEKGGLWVYEIATEKIRHVKVGNARGVRIVPGSDDYFAMQPCGPQVKEGRTEFLASSMSSPGEVLSRISIDKGAATFEGEVEVWQHLPRAYESPLLVHGRYHEFLILVNSRQQTVEFQPMDWYNWQSYDMGYQNVLGVVEIPGQNLLIFPIQRDSCPVIYDPEKRMVVGKIPLADRRGNPSIHFLKSRREAWANDYDTILRLDSANWSVLNKARLQEADKNHGWRFIGGFWLNKSETLCAVARPYSGDVLALDTRTFKVSHSAAVGGEPLEVVLLADDRVIARDWHSGKILRGRLRAVQGNSD